jgi:membrane fusion protein, macrolide-specific efflux system
VVPYSAVTTLGPVKTVEVMKEDGTTEKRTVTTGITDYTNIVITGGLSAGEKIVVSATAAASSTAFPAGNGFFLGGVGGSTRR